MFSRGQYGGTGELERGFAETDSASLSLRAAERRGRWSGVVSQVLSRVSDQPVPSSREGQ